MKLSLQTTNEKIPSLLSPLIYAAKIPPTWIQKTNLFQMILASAWGKHRHEQQPNQFSCLRSAKALLNLWRLLRPTSFKGETYANIN